MRCTDGLTPSVIDLLIRTVAWAPNLSRLSLLAHQIKCTLPEYEKASSKDGKPWVGGRRGGRGGWNSKCIWPLACAAIVTLASHLPCTCGCEAVIRGAAALCHPVKKKHAHHVHTSPDCNPLLMASIQTCSQMFGHLSPFGHRKVGRVMEVTDDAKGGRCERV